VPENAILTAKSLAKTYGNFTALHPADLTIAKGEIVGLVGKNGAGKTTFLKLITGQTLPSGGRLELFGADTPDRLGKARQRTGAIVEEPCFFRNMTARQNLEYYRIQRGIPGKEAIDAALREVDLADTGRKKFKDFSIGMKQRLGLALALMNHPDFLILDEPINGLDPMGIVEMRELLLNLNREKRITMLISCHVLAEMQNLATSYVFIDRGKIIKKMTARQLEEDCGQYLRLVVDQETRAAAVLDKHFPGIRYSVRPDKSIHIHRLPGKSDEVSRLMADSEISLFSLETRGTSLEDYFVSLVRGQRLDD